MSLWFSGFCWFRDFSTHAGTLSAWSYYYDFNNLEAKLLATSTAGEYKEKRHSVGYDDWFWLSTLKLLNGSREERRNLDFSLWFLSLLSCKACYLKNSNNLKKYWLWAKKWWNGEWEKEVINTNYDFMIICRSIHLIFFDMTRI